MQSASISVGHPNYMGIGITLTVIVLRLTLFIGVNDHSLIKTPILKQIYSKF